MPPCVSGTQLLPDTLDQPANVEPLSSGAALLTARAIRETLVPTGNWAEQVDAQSIPLGGEVSTRPCPVPANVTVRVTRSAVSRGVGPAAEAPATPSARSTLPAASPTHHLVRLGLKTEKLTR